MLKFMTAGESHGPCLVGILEGLPANLKLDEDYINFHLARRQGGYGRGSRMKIEKDRVKILGGINQGLSTGAPLSLELVNRGRNIDLVEVKEPRPGHADLAGLLKYNQVGARAILERASARETAMRVAVGSVARLFLREFDIEIYSHVIELGRVKSKKTYYKFDILSEIDRAQSSDMNVIDGNLESEMIEEIKYIEEKKDSIGGRVELIAVKLPVGLGSHTSWQERLDGQLAQALVSIPAIKGVEVGLGFDGIARPGSAYQDEIYYDGAYRRKTNNAGGIEGGMTNGEDLVLSMVMKPIPTLKLPLDTVNIDNKERASALVERADTSALPAVSVVGESMVALVLANSFLQKFGGDSMEEVRDNYRSYNERIDRR